MSCNKSQVKVWVLNQLYKGDKDKGDKGVQDVQVTLKSNDITV